MLDRLVLILVGFTKLVGWAIAHHIIKIAKNRNSAVRAKEVKVKAEEILKYAFPLKKWERDQNL